MRANLINRSSWSRLQELFSSNKVINYPEVAVNPHPQGIVRTVFLDNIVHYNNPVRPSQVRNTQQLIKQFGVKRHSSFFRKVTTAARNTFKS